MAFAIHLAQKVVVIIELEQWVYQLMVAPATHLKEHVFPLAGLGSFFIVLGKGLPIPGIDFFEDFPLLTLVVANLELANSFQVPLGGLRILLLITGCLDPVLCLILILLVRVIDNEQGDMGQLVDLIPILYSKTFEKKGSKFQLLVVKCVSKLRLT